MSNVRRSLIISFAEKYSQMFIQLVTSLIIARILTPHDIGIFSVGAAIISIAHTVREFGVSNFLIQTKELSLPVIRSAFTVTLSTSLLLAAALFGSRGYVADFYHEKDIEPIIMLLAVNFLIIPFSSVNMALLKRELRMGAIYKVNIASQLVQSATAIILALKGFGFMSLAWSGLAGMLITVVLTGLYHPEYAFLLPSFKAIRKVLRFSVLSTLSSLISEISFSASDLIIGKTLSFTSVGYFSRAMGFVTMVQKATLDGINPVILPYFSRHNRSGAGLNQIYIKAVDYQLSVAWAILGGAACSVHPLIYVLYGPNWVAASPIAAWLCLGLALRCQMFLAVAGFTSLGKPGKMVTVQFIYQPIKIALILRGALIDLEEVAKSLVAAELLGYLLSHGILWHTLRFSLAGYLLKILRALVITLFSSAVPYWASLHFGNAQDLAWQQLSISLAGGASGWIVGLAITRHPLLGEATGAFKRVFL